MMMPTSLYTKEIIFRKRETYQHQVWLVVESRKAPFSYDSQLATELCSMCALKYTFEVIAIYAPWRALLGGQQVR